MKKHERLGKVLIASSLVAIGLVVALALARQKQSNIEQIRIQGISLTHALSMLPVDLLLPDSQGKGGGLLHAMLIPAKPSDFAYGVITSAQGKVLAEVAGPGVAPALDPLPADVGSAYGERMLIAPVTGKPVREFYGPLAGAGNASSHIRIGYFEPGYRISGSDISFLGMLALLTFILVPIVYFLLKREMRPLSDIQEKLHTLISKSSADTRLPRPDLDLPGFADRVSIYVDQAHRRIAELESERISMLTANRLLEYNSSKMNFVLGSVPDGILILDPAGHITYASEKVEPLLGVDRQTVLSESIETWCQDDALRHLLLRQKNHGTQPARFDAIELTPRNAPDKCLHVSAQPLIVPDEARLFGTLIVIHDATLERIGQRASHEFVAHVSHELKSPLNAIAIYSEMLQTDSLSNDDQRIEASNVIHQQVERMAGLINNLLSISKLETGGLRPQVSRVKTEELLHDIYSSEAHRAHSCGIHLNLEVPRDIGALPVDKDLMRIAIHNLLTNAIKYSDASGIVTLSATETDSHVVIAVSDTGVGIAPEDQARIFEKFYRSAREADKRSGHGLGLYLASQIVQLHHGQLTLESELGEGSKFSIHLKKALVTQSADMVLL